MKMDVDSITKRQDICLNMTKLSDDEIMAEIKKYKFPLDPENIERDEDDFSFNYNNTEFKSSSSPPSCL